MINTKKILGFRVGIHTFIKEIENLVADQLGLDIIRANLSLQHQGSHGKLDSAKTLYQCGIHHEREHIYCTYNDVSGTKLALTEKEINKPVQGHLGTLDMTYKHPMA